MSFLIKNGFFHIFSANFTNKILQFGVSVFITRLISKELYGSYAYAVNILSFFLLLDGLGVSVGVLQFASRANDRLEALSFLKYGLKVGGLFNTILALAIFVFTFIVPLPLQNSNTILRMLFLVPFASIVFNCFQLFLRARLMNKEFSFVTFFNTLMLLVFTVIFGYIFDVNGVVAAKYCSLVLSVSLAWYLMRTELNGLRSIALPEKGLRKSFMKFSITTMMANTISQLLYLIDTFLIGLIVKSATVLASYKVSTMIPFSLFFIPLSVMTFAYPYIAKNSEKKELVRYYFMKMTKIMLILNGLLSGFLILFAPFVIRTVFGSNYLDAVLPFRILSFGYLIAGTFRIPSGNLIASLGKAEINLYNALFSGIANIILDVLLITNFGAIGAAVATVLIFVISSVISGFYLSKYLKAGHQQAKCV